MRKIILKNHSTKTERKFYELLKKNKIPFEYKARVEGKEVDFLIGKYAVELDAHPQNSARNHLLLDNGYIPIHFANWKLKEMEEWLKTQKQNGNRSRN